MWICSKCGARNDDSNAVCILCREKRPAAPQPKEDVPPQGRTGETRRKNMLLFISATFLLILSLAMITGVIRTVSGKNAPQDMVPPEEESLSQETAPVESPGPTEEYSVRIDPYSGTVDDEHSFTFAWSEEGTPLSFSKYAICLDGQTTGDSQIGATIELPCYNISWTPSKDDCHVAGHKGDTWLFYIRHDMAVLPIFTSFLYNISENRLTCLEHGSMEIVSGSVNEAFFVAQAESTGAGSLVPMRVFDWAGDRLYSRDDVLGTFPYENAVYFAAYDGNEFGIFRLEHPGFQEQKVCRLALPEGAYIWFDQSGIAWTYPDENGLWTEGRMDLSALHDVVVEIKALPETAGQVSEPETVVVPGGDAPSGEDSSSLYNDLCAQVEEHYNALFQPAGSYVCFDFDYDETSTEYLFVLRYQMSEQEAAEREAIGAVVEPNVYTATVWINKTTGEARDEWGWDSWYADLG